MHGRRSEERWDYEERRRRERNYRVMFRCALAFLALGIIVAITGGAAAVLTPANGDVLSFGLMLAILSGASAWLSVDSTVRIIELDMQDEQGRR